MAKPWKLPEFSRESTAGQAAIGILSVRLAETWSRSRAVSRSGSSKLLHDLRISARRLRYSMETYAPCLGPEFHEAIEEIKEIQAVLGRLHDRDVLLDRLSDYHRERVRRDVGIKVSSRTLARNRLEEQALARIAAECRKERRELHRGFLTSWRQMKHRGARSAILNMLKAGRKR